MSRRYHVTFRLAFLPIVLATMTPAGCGGEGSDSTSAAAGSQSSGTGGAGGGAMIQVALQFEGRVGGSVFDCAGTYAGLGTASTEVSLTDFRFYIHDIRLHQEGGADVPVQLDQDGLWQVENVVLLDFENKSGTCLNGTQQTNTTVHAKVPEGSYDGISFKLGVPFALNHGDASVAPSPLNLTALFWSWNGGYKFLRVDSEAAAGGSLFNLHVGSTGCMGDFASGGVTACDRPNRAEVTLTGFDPSAGKVIADYAALISGSDLSINLGDAPGCMSGATDPDCAPVFQRLGIDIQDGSIHPDMQTFFRVE